MRRLLPCEVTSVVLDDGGLVLVAPDGAVLRGNATATYLWHALRRTLDREEVTAAAAHRYGVSAELVRHDLDRMIDILRSAGIEVIS